MRFLLALVCVEQKRKGGKPTYRLKVWTHLNAFNIRILNSDWKRSQFLRLFGTLERLLICATLPAYHKLKSYIN